MRSWLRRLADYNTRLGFWLRTRAYSVARISKYGVLCIDTSADEYRRGLNIVLRVLNISGTLATRETPFSRQVRRVATVVANWNEFIAKKDT